MRQPAGTALREVAHLAHSEGADDTRPKSRPSFTILLPPPPGVPRRGGAQRLDVQAEQPLRAAG